MTKFTDLDKKLLIKELIELLHYIQQIDLDYDNLFVMSCIDHQELWENGTTEVYDLMDSINWTNIKEHLELDFEPNITKDDEIHVIFTFKVICQDCYREIQIANKEKYFTDFEIDKNLSYEQQEKQIINQLKQKIKTKEIILDEWIEY
ncbi:hypothetical protein MNF30_03275 [Mycoplasma mycoides subsp. capri]|uniref:hypothetical protein n=1 Tax=Mycoplasma mycoides TaxID=2102 RepID=UPI00223F0400|nr:hypothetical protein [Mycoplasma mycoides]UZK63960.1 hypothetical protein MNF30_03275 [Mycoplasma mycoides subsp. capri]